MKLRQHYIFNYVFLASLLLLILNDHVLKSLYHNWLTGKLSDISGIVVLALFLCLFFSEKRKLLICVFCALAFVFWKSGYSQTLINFWNEHIAVLKMHRTIDYSDLLCLPVLAPLYYYQPKETSLSFTKKLIAYPLIAITGMAIVATSRAKGFSGNTVHVNDEITLKLSKPAFIAQLEKKQIDYTVDSTYIIKKDTFERMVLNNIRFGADTIHETVIRIHPKKQKTIVYIESVTLSGNSKDNFMMDYKQYKHWQQEYKAESIRYFEKMEAK